MSSNAKSSSDSVGPIVESFLHRRRQGERVSVDECVAAHPDLADELREVIPSALMLEELKAEVTSGQDQADSELDATHPTQLGDYRIVREIGRGGMGIVYEAEEPRLARRVALKVLPAQASLRPETVRRFRREAQAAAQLHHTGIVHVYGCGVDGGIHYIVMEYVIGHGLDQIVTAVGRMGGAVGPAAGAEGEEDTKKHGLQTIADAPDSTADDMALALFSAASAGGSSSNLGHDPSSDSAAEERQRRKKSEYRPANSQLNRRYWRNVASLGLQIAEALEHAHCRGVVHRDIKPSNLLLDARGVVRITDFGLAKAETVGDLTHSGNVLGTLRYLPPEGLKGTADVRSDVYSLGLTLYELTTLTPARGASGRSELVRQIVDQDVPRPRSIHRGIPRDLDTIIQKATHPDPSRRYQTAGAMAADLQRYLLDQPIRARRTSVLGRAWRGCLRNPLAATVAAAALVAVAVAVGSAFILVHAEKIRALEIADHNAALAQAERKARHEAEAARQEEERSAHVAQTVTDVLVRDLILLARADSERGDQVTLRDAVDRAAGRLDTSFEGQPEIKAGVQEAIGLAYFSMGLYEQAHSLLRDAFVWRRDNLGYEKLDTLRAMLNLASCHDRLGEHTVSRDLQQEAIELLRASYGDDNAEVLRARMNESFLLDDTSDWDLLPADEE